MGVGATGGAVGLGDVPLERLEEEITQLSGHVAAATAQLLLWIGEYDRREGWKTWGCRSAAHWLSWKCGEGLHTAREKVRTARALEHLPVLAASFAAGEVSYSKVRAVTRVALPADDVEWTERAKTCTGAELERIIAAVRSCIDRDENADAGSAFERRAAQRSSRDDAVDRVVLSGPVDQIEVVWAAVEVISSKIVDDAVAGTGRDRSSVVSERGGLDAVRFDAIVRMAEHIIAADTDAAERGNIGRLNLNLDTDGLAELADPEAAVAGEVVAGEVSVDGRRVAPEVARRWACDIRASVTVEAGGHVHDEGHTTKTPNRRLRRALRRRDNGICRFPGCGASQWLQAHHVVHWVNGGPTDLANLVSVCSFHHHLVHEGGWNVAIDDGLTVTWASPDGTRATVEPLSGDPAAVTRNQRVTPRSIESRWHNDPLDFEFVVTVLAENCLALRRQNVPAGTSDDGLGLSSA